MTTSILSRRWPLVIGSLGCIGAVSYAVWAEERRDILLSSQHPVAELTLESSTKITPTTYQLRFKLPFGHQRFGHHLNTITYINVHDTHQQIMRPFTPISHPADRGFVDFIVKQYPWPNGDVARFLTSLRPGQCIEVSGPHIEYTHDPSINHIGFIVGGTGIAPALQLIRSIPSSTHVSVLYMNMNPRDIPLRSELDTLVRDSNGRVRVHYGVDHPDDTWTGLKGFVSQAMVEETMPAPTESESVLIVCGPPGMMRHVCGEKGSRGEQGPLRGVLKEMGYNKVYKL